ncbi:MAG: glycosyltransferase family 4 protein [Gammaproteobacteria bacterium]|nr:glycosyltransferase family 4 protein [Gammaproteobacteria bacterium]
MDKKLKIGLVTPFFLPEIGGANIYCYELARAFAAQGHEVHLFSVPGAQEDPAYTLHPILTRDLASDLNSLRPYDMDVWHALFFFYVPLALLKPNVFVTGHGDDCFGFRFRYHLSGKGWLNQHLFWRLPVGLRRLFERAIRAGEEVYTYVMFTLASRRARRIITVSSFTRTRLIERFPLLKGRVSVIPPGVQEHFFHSAPLPRAPQPFFLSVTRLDEEDRIKNIHNVIHALGALKDSHDFHYTVISGTVHGGYKDELLDLVEKYGLQDRVQIEGRKTDQELLDYYRQADLFILVSYAEAKNFEGFGIVFLEANANGVPVLTSRDGGMRDYVREGRNGLYVADPSAEGIRVALQRFLDGEVTFDPQVVRDAPERYRWIHIAEAIESEYRVHGVD